MDNTQTIGGLLSLGILALCVFLGFYTANVLWLLAIAIGSSFIYATMLRSGTWQTATGRGVNQISLIAMTYFTQLITLAVAYGIGWLVGRAFSVFG